MLDSATKFIQVVGKVPISFVVALFVAVTITLFVPDYIAEVLALDAFRSAFRWLLGPTWLLLAAIVSTKIMLFFTSGFLARRAIRAKQKQLHELTPEEKGYLAPFIANHENTIHVDMSDGVAGGLLRKNVIYRASSTFDMLRGVPYNLQPWAREYLSRHPETLDGATGRPLTPREHRGLDW